MATHRHLSTAQNIEISHLINPIISKNLAEPPLLKYLEKTEDRKILYFQHESRTKHEGKPRFEPHLKTLPVKD